MITSNSSSIIHCTIGYLLSANDYYYYRDNYHNYNSNSSNGYGTDSTYELYLAATLSKNITIVDKNWNDSSITNATFLNTQYYEKSPSLFYKLGDSYVYHNAPWLKDICYFANVLIVQSQKFDSIN